MLTVTSVALTAAVILRSADSQIRQQPVPSASLQHAVAGSPPKNQKPELIEGI